MNALRTRQAGGNGKPLKLPEPVSLRPSVLMSKVDLGMLGVPAALCVLTPEGKIKRLDPKTSTHGKLGLLETGTLVAPLERWLTDNETHAIELEGAKIITVNGERYATITPEQANELVSMVEHRRESSAYVPDNRLPMTAAYW